jgi:hypothetical protein
LSAANSRFSKTHTRAAHFWQPLPTAGLQPAPDQEGNSAEFGDIPSTPALCPSDCFVTQPSSFSNSSSTFLQLLFRFYVVFASSLRTRRSKSVLFSDPPRRGARSRLHSEKIWYFCFSGLAAPNSVLAVPILISKQIPYELLALATRRKKLHVTRARVKAVLHVPESGHTEPSDFRAVNCTAWNLWHPAPHMYRIVVCTHLQASTRCSVLRVNNA